MQNIKNGHNRARVLLASPFRYTPHALVRRWSIDRYEGAPHGSLGIGPPNDRI